jgi:hypothetical protein
MVLLRFCGIVGDTGEGEIGDGEIGEIGAGA